MGVVGAGDVATRLGALKPNDLIMATGKSLLPLLRRYNNANKPAAPALLRWPLNAKSLHRGPSKTASIGSQLINVRSF